MPNDDAVDERKALLCCALCCLNCSYYPTCGCCSGRIGLCCLNLEVCCKTGAPCLPCCCCGPTCDGEGCCNVQAQLCCLLVSAAFPSTSEVPAAVTILGCTVWPKVGCCVRQAEIMERD